MQAPPKIELKEFSGLSPTNVCPAASCIGPKPKIDTMKTRQETENNTAKDFN